MNSSILTVWKRLQELLATYKQAKESASAELQLPKDEGNYHDCPHQPCTSELRIGDVVAIFTRKEGPEDVFHIGTVLAISKEKLRVQYWQSNRCDGLWSKTCLRRVGSSLNSSRNLNMREHTGIIWAEDGVIDKVPSLQGKARGAIDSKHLHFLRNEARRYRQKSLHTLKGDLRSFKSMILQGRKGEIGKDASETQTEHRAFRRLVSGAMSFISVRSSSFSSNSSESSTMETTPSDLQIEDVSVGSTSRLKRLTTV